MASNGQSKDSNFDAVPEDDFDDADYITLEYEDGGTEHCEVLGLFGCGKKEYIALVPESDDECVYLYEYDEHDDGTFALIDIEDDDEFAKVSAAYEQIMEEEDE